MVLSFLLALIAFLALALSMDRHHRQLWRRSPGTSTRRLLRGAGWAGLTLSLVAGVNHSGWAVGLVFWFGLLQVAALLVATFFTLRYVRAAAGAEG